ncbi:hypothetical protein CEUSTIGMA_g693.t1 [Chlamydomonas eustigma]|uniref:Uncharacterized protein n=1 Tax=Chlamydomonas eustigma TaxID=1157962 RepID=A0A250WRB8_9CHLO|nr:hypothetical protein CEUSTIGMA_g693.t1 [Chlamydomonas eustigma]|eukprot:GAX73239.1 hypothetical protein CEUSTIGMA_g693.t1 [Chlamydomonas eustigma]
MHFDTARERQHQQEQQANHQAETLLPLQELMKSVREAFGSNCLPLAVLKNNIQLLDVIEEPGGEHRDATSRTDSGGADLLNALKTPSYTKPGYGAGRLLATSSTGLHGLAGVVGVAAMAKSLASKARMAHFLQGSVQRGQQTHQESSTTAASDLKIADQVQVTPLSHPVPYSKGVLSAYDLGHAIDLQRQEEDQISPGNLKHTTESIPQLSGHDSLHPSSFKDVLKSLKMQEVRPLVQPPVQQPLQKEKSGRLSEKSESRLQETVEELRQAMAKMQSTMMTLISHFTSSTSDSANSGPRTSSHLLLTPLQGELVDLHPVAGSAHLTGTQGGPQGALPVVSEARGNLQALHGQRHGDMGQNSQSRHHDTPHELSLAYAVSASASEAMRQPAELVRPAEEGGVQTKQ